jgi:putative aldouronate transport system substrate-binding protein
MKKITVYLLTITLLCTLLMGCGKTENKTSEEETNGSTVTDETADGTSESEGTEEKDYSKQEPYTVKLLLPGTATTEDCEEVSALASTILKEKYNTTLEVVRVGFGTYAQEVNLMFSSGEKLDMLYNNRDIFTSAVSNGQIVEIGQYLDEYAPEMKAQISEEDWACTTVNDGIYAVPANKEKAVAWGFSFVKSVADELGVDYSEIDTEEELEPLLQAVKDNYPDMYPVMSNGGTMNTMTTADDLGYDFGVLEDCTDPNNTTVVNWYETDQYREIVERRYEWTQKGLIMPDAASNTEPWATMISSGKAFGRFCNVKPGIEAEHQKATGKEIVVLPMTDAYTTTTRLDILWYVAHNSEKPERTVQVMNEIYTNPELQNILVNGVEGKHYEYVNTEKTMVRYPEGVDGSNTGYPSYPWAWLNEMITPVWEGGAETLWEETNEYNKTAIISPGKGFGWNNENVINEVTACNNVRNKYANALDCGSVDPAVALPQFIKELKDAGVDRIIAEKQKQFDEWLAAKK